MNENDKQAEPVAWRINFGNGFHSAWVDGKPSEKVLNHWLKQGRKLDFAYTRPAEPVAAPRFNCWSTSEGDSWFDHPADAQAIYERLGGFAKVGDEYELLAGWRSVTARYRIVSIDGDDFEVECVSHTHPAQPVQPAVSQEPVRLDDDDLTKIYMRFVGHEGLYPRLFEDIAGCVMTAMFEKSPPPAATINEQLQPYTSEKMKGRFAFQPKHIGGWLVDQQTGRSYEPSFAKEYALAMLDAIAEAEKAKGGV